jgi:RimJ/RimL family protein N-acetyltransferase
MPRVIFRPTVTSDLNAVIGEPLPYRIRALTAVLQDPDSPADDGKILGVGGLAFPPNSPVWAFVQQAPEAKNYPVAFHRAGLMAMKMIRESKIREVVATCDADNPAAIRWLRRLGFVEGPTQKLPGKIVWFFTSPPPDQSRTG